eukprot:PhF_6_TR31388/c0_g1_i1/m.45972/K00683/QPCT; glutaminyl-peptide cyclotransferase
MPPRYPKSSHSTSPGSTTLLTTIIRLAKKLSIVLIPLLIFSYSARSVYEVIEPIPYYEVDCRGIHGTVSDMFPTDVDLEQLKLDTETILHFGPRVGGSYSPGYRATQGFMKKKFDCISQTHTDTTKAHPFMMEENTFTTTTVLGERTFTNYILSSTNTNTSCGTYVFAAHYDTKLFHEFNFVGATDSGVPVAMLLTLAKMVARLRNDVPYHRAPKIVFLFLDGEEAFKEWTSQDSLYGSRHLATKWHEEDILKQIKLFTLLDLLGAADPKFHAYDGTSLKWYNNLSHAETTVKTKLTKFRKTKQLYFPRARENVIGMKVEDDHVPFVQRGVKALHVIPVPFPGVWHTEKDNVAALDWETTNDLLRVFAAFIDDILQK